jgi:hypothetical protein
VPPPFHDGHSWSEYPRGAATMYLGGGVHMRVGVRRATGREHSGRTTGEKRRRKGYARPSPTRMHQERGEGRCKEKYKRVASALPFGRRAPIVPPVLKQLRPVVYPVSPAVELDHQRLRRRAAVVAREL